MSSLAEKALIAAIKILGTLPLKFRQKLGDWIGAVLNFVPSRDRKVALAQLAHFLPDADGEAVIAGLLKHLGRVGMETLDLSALKAKVALSNQAEFDGLVADRSTPLVVLTGHLGNWELLAACFLHGGADLAAVGRVTRNPLAHTAIDFLRRQYGLRMLWRADRAGMGDIIETLKNNAWLGALIDQDTQVSGITIPFFGQPAHTPVTLIRLGQRYNARFITAFVMREADGSYRGYFEPVEPNPDEVKILQIYHERLESLIRLYPEQWVWFHKRWRTQPNGERLSTSQYLAWLTSHCPRDAHAGAPASLPAGR